MPPTTQASPSLTPFPLTEQSILSGIQSKVLTELISEVPRKMEGKLSSSRTILQKQRVSSKGKIFAIFLSAIPHVEFPGTWRSRFLLALSSTAVSPIKGKEWQKKPTQQLIYMRVFSRDLGWVTGCLSSAKREMVVLSLRQGLWEQQTKDSRYWSTGYPQHSTSPEPLAKKVPKPCR